MSRASGPDARPYRAGGLPGEINLYWALFCVGLLRHGKVWAVGRQARVSALIVRVQTEYALGLLSPRRAE